MKIRTVTYRTGRNGEGVLLRFGSGLSPLLSKVSRLIKHRQIKNVKDLNNVGLLV